MKTVVREPHAEHGGDSNIHIGSEKAPPQRHLEPQPASGRRWWSRVLIPFAVLSVVIAFLGWRWGQPCAVPGWRA
jgi:hypothetical protein